MKANIKSFFLIVALIFSSLVRGQAVEGLSNPNSFEVLSNKRIELSNKIPDLQSQISVIYDDDTSAVLREIFYIKFYADSYKRKINSISPADSVKSMFRDSVSIWKENVNFYNEQELGLKQRLDIVRENLKLKASLKKELSATNAELLQVEYKINQLMIPKISQQNFMLWASIFFVVLMGILLMTFYYVVRNDVNVRLAIFGSDSGIQFIALFSIIIAIIIFGLTGVLEGKELSALLGSVAGYILGKVKFSSQGNNSNNGTDVSGKNVNMQENSDAPHKTT